MHRQAGSPAQMGANPLGEFGMRVDPGANGGATQRQLAQLFCGSAGTLGRSLHLPGISDEFLAQADRRRILEMGPAGLDHGHEFLRFSVKGIL